MQVQSKVNLPQFQAVKTTSLNNNKNKSVTSTYSKPFSVVSNTSDLLTLSKSDSPVSYLYFAGAERKVMSYNALNFFRSSRGLRKKPKSIAALADVIKKEDPDVIAFQEVGDRSVLENFNNQHLNGQYPNVVIFPIGGFQRGIRVAIMSKANVKVIDAKSHWEEQCGTLENCGKRDFLEATFETDTGYQFTVYNAHFKSMRGGEKETMPKRMSEARVAARIVDEQLTHDPNANIIVAGDMNTHFATKYGNPVIRTLTLVDDNNPDNDLTEVMLKDEQPDPTHRGGGRYQPSKLDYTFVSKNLLPQLREAYVAGRFDKNPWKLASDHLPLVTVFEEPDVIPEYKPPLKKSETKTLELAQNAVSDSALEKLPENPFKSPARPDFPMTAFDDTPVDEPAKGMQRPFKNLLSMIKEHRHKAG